MMTNTQIQTSRQASRNRLSGLLVATVLAIILATIANLGLYAAVGQQFPEVAAWPGASPGQIVSANVVYLLIGAVTYAIIMRFSSRPQRLYMIVATTGLLLSLALPISAGFGFGPPGIPPAGGITVITLSAMHLVSYAISVPLFIRLT